MGNCFFKDKSGLTRKQQKKLKKFNHKNIKDFSFENIFTTARVCSVYDGDTCRIIFFSPFEKNNNKIIKLNCRLAGIDTPELRTKNIKEKEAAIVAKNKLINLINNKFIKVYLGKNDKYGRTLATFYYCNIENFLFKNSINQIMIDSGYANKYDGGKKVKINL